MFIKQKSTWILLCLFIFQNHNIKSLPSGKTRSNNPFLLTNPDHSELKTSEKWYQSQILEIMYTGEENKEVIITSADGWEEHDNINWFTTPITKEVFLYLTGLSSILALDRPPERTPENFKNSPYNRN